MVHDEILFSVDGANARRVSRRGLEDLGLEERRHLQEWVLANPDVLGVGTIVITSEFDRWQAPDGSRVADRLDILALDPDGRLVVVELKRGAAPHTVHMQAINYAAMVSRLTPEDVADLYVAGHPSVTRDGALDLLTTQHLLSQEGIRRPRLVLIASDFPPAVTTSVVWLNEQNVDITLIRFRAYEVANEVVVSFSRLYPVPDVEEFTIGRRMDAAVPVAQPEGPPWDRGSLAKLARQANPATLALLDLCASLDDMPVGVKDIAAAAGISELSVRGQLAGLTMMLKHPRNGFAQSRWPTTVHWLPGGIASYSLDGSLAELWREIRSAGVDPE